MSLNNKYLFLDSYKNCVQFLWQMVTQRNWSNSSCCRCDDEWFLGYNPSFMALTGAQGVTLSVRLSDGNKVVILQLKSSSSQFIICSNESRVIQSEPKILRLVISNKLFYKKPSWVDISFFQRSVFNETCRLIHTPALLTDSHSAAAADHTDQDCLEDICPG